jgi:hypothetical protein
VLKTAYNKHIQQQTLAKAFFPELQHFYKRAEPGMTSMESMQLDGETDERVSEAISVWLDGLK